MQINRPLVALVVCAFILTTPAEAQSQEGSTVGFGVSINSISVAGENETVPGALSLVPFTISVPVTTSSFRLEPEVGYFRYSQSQNDNSYTSSRLGLGTGVFHVSRHESTLLQLGGRVGIARRSTSIDGSGGDQSTSATDFFIGPAVGGEYYLSDQFSIGIEARFLYMNHGTPDTAADDFSASRLGTSGFAFMRVHF